MSESTSISESESLSKIVDAKDDLAEIHLDVPVVNNPASVSQTAFILAGVKLLSTLDLSVLNLQGTPFTIDVAEGSVRDVTLGYSGNTLINLGTQSLDLFMYKLNETTGKYEFVQKFANEVDVSLFPVLSRISGDTTITGLTKGKYIFLLGSATDDGLLDLNVGTIAKITTISQKDVTNGETEITGNVITGLGDINTPIGTDINTTGAKVTLVVSEINDSGTASVAGTVIQGAYGKLTIHEDGSYSYVRDQNLENIGKVDTFTYTISNGTSSDTAQLNIRIDSNDVQVVWDDVHPSADGVVTITATDDAVSTIGQVSVLGEANRYVTITSPNGLSTDTNRIVTSGHADNPLGDALDIAATENSSLITVQEGEVVQISLKSLIPTGTGYGVKVEIQFKDTSGLLGGLFPNYQTVDNWTSTTNGQAHSFELNASTFGAISGEYRIKVTSIHTGTGASATAQFGVIDVETIVYSPGLYKVTDVAPIAGNLFDNDVLGATSGISIKVADTQAGLSTATAISTPQTIVRDSGTLTVNSDGTYKFDQVADSSHIGKVETFYYQFTTPTGISNIAKIEVLIDSGSVYMDRDGTGFVDATTGNDLLVSLGGNETFHGAGGNDTLIYNLLNSVDATGGNGTGANGGDNWTDFTLGSLSNTNSDYVDIRELLDGQTVNSGNIANYIGIRFENNHAVLTIDRDGAGSTYTDKVDLVTLGGIDITNHTEQDILQQLLTNNQIIY